MNVAVLGGGNGAYATAADLALAGHRVRLWRRSTQDLRAVQAGGTIALVGASGVGKSTLINCLLGFDRQKTEIVREHDDRGQHTTHHRELILMPNGSLILDTPGMRELQLWDVEEGMETTFGEIGELAAAVISAIAIIRPSRAAPCAKLWNLARSTPGVLKTT